MNICPYCNKEFEGKPYFCNYCGKPLFVGNTKNVSFEPTKRQSISADDNRLNPVSSEELNQSNISGDSSINDDCVIHDDSPTTSCSSQNIYENMYDVNESYSQINNNDKQKNDHFTIDEIHADEKNNKNSTINKNVTSRYSSSYKMMVTNDSEERTSDKDEKSSKWLPFFLTLIFVVLIVGGLIVFFIYDKKFNEQKTIRNTRIEDSIRNSFLEKETNLKRDKELSDSLRLLELEQVHKEDSLERIKKHEEWAKDSMVIDKRMSDLVHKISPTNKILAKYMDYNECFCYYADTLNPILKLACFDGRTNEVSNILIDNIQCKLVDHFITPDSKSFVMLCRDDAHDYGLAYKINMSSNTVEDYKSMDDMGNKCFDIGKTNRGFYMKFGRGDSIAFKNLYTINYDKYGNYINKE